MRTLTGNWFTPIKGVTLYSLNFGSLVHVILLSNYLIFDSRAVLHSTTFKQHHTMLLQHCFLARNIRSDNFPTAKFQQRTLPVPRIGFLWFSGKNLDTNSFSLRATKHLPWFRNNFLWHICLGSNFFPSVLVYSGKTSCAVFAQGRLHLQVWPELVSQNGKHDCWLHPQSWLSIYKGNCKKVMTVDWSCLLGCIYWELTTGVAGNLL